MEQKEKILLHVDIKEDSGVKVERISYNIRPTVKLKKLFDNYVTRARAEAKNDALELSFFYNGRELKPDDTPAGRFRSPALLCRLTIFLRSFSCGPS